MSKKHKLFASTATAALVASAIVPVASAASLNDFDSVPAYAQEAVQHLADNNILQGDANGNFNPSQTLTRAQAAEVLAKALKLEATGTEDFSDVNPGDWFYNAVVATSPQLFEGDGTGKFNPKAQLTRAQAAKVISVAYNLTGEADLSVFTDANSVPAWSKEFFSAAVANGVINGKGSALAPNAQISRAEFATMVKRAMDSELTVESVSAINDISVNEGDVASLANTVEVTLSNGTKAQKEVKWDVTALDTTKPGVYTVKGDVADTDLEASVKVTVVAVAPEVTGVSAINGAELKVTFNKAIDADTVVDASTGTLVDDVFTITAIDNATAFGTTNILKASLSEDGKTLTILASTGNKFNGKYAVTVAKEAVKTVKQEKVPAYSTVVEANDTTRPVINGVSYKDAATAVVEFSEPVDVTNLGVTAKRTDGVALNNSTVLTAAKFTVDSDNPRKVIVDLSAVNSADFNKNIELTLVGVADYKGNLVSPNPTTITVKYDTSDETKAAVSSVTRTASNKLQIKFDRPLAVKPTVKVGSQVISATNVAISPTDKTVANVTLDVAASGADFTTLPTGLQNVEVSAYQGLNLVTGETVLKVVNFDVDDVKPTVASTSVQKIDGVEYLIVNYNEDVVIPTYTSEQITGNKVVNYVTSAITPIDLVNSASTTAHEAQVTLHGVSSTETKSKSVKINLSNISSAAYTVSLPAGIVEDVFGNAAAVKTGVEFTRTTNEVKPEVSSVVAGSTNDEILVNFDSEVDAQSALTKANYNVEGSTIDKVELLNNTTTAQVKLTLAKNTNTFNGSHVVTVKNVMSKTNTVIDDTTKVVALAENVRPTITKVELTANDTLKLTFSEAVKANTVADTADSNNDFIVKIGGVTYSGTLTDTMAADGKEATIVLGTALTPEQYAATITLEASTNFDIEDLVGNKMEVFSTITVAK